MHLPHWWHQLMHLPHWWHQSITCSHQWSWHWCSRPPRCPWWAADTPGSSRRAGCSRVCSWICWRGGWRSRSARAGPWCSPGAKSQVRENKVLEKVLQNKVPQKKKKRKWRERTNRSLSRITSYFKKWQFRITSYFKKIKISNNVIFQKMTISNNVIFQKNDNFQLTLPPYCSKCKLFYDIKYHISTCKIAEQWHWIALLHPMCLLEMKRQNILWWRIKILKYDDLIRILKY